MVGCVACRRALETGQTFLEHYLPAYNFGETQHGTEYKKDPEFPILTKKKGLKMLAKLQTTEHLIYTELDKT